MALRWRFLFGNQSIETQKKTNSLAEVWWVRRAPFICHIVPVCSSTFPPTLTGSQHTRSLTVTWSTHMVPLNLPEHCDLPCPAMRITTGTWSSSSSSPPSPPDIPLLSHNPTTQARQPNTHPLHERRVRSVARALFAGAQEFGGADVGGGPAAAPDFVGGAEGRRRSVGFRVGFLGENGMRV